MLWTKKYWLHARGTLGCDCHCGILIALLLPAVRRLAKRHAVLRTNTSNSSACGHNYHDAMRLSPAILTKYVGTAMSSTCWGWGAFLLPI